MGSVTPRSVPATLAVYPLRKWYIAWPELSLDTGGSSQSVARKKDDAVGVAGHLRLVPVFNVVDRVRHAAVLRLGRVKVVDVAVVDGIVLEQGVRLDGAVDLGLVLLREVDGLCVAASFKVENAVVVPSVLVVSDQKALWICRQRGLSRAREAKEERRVAVLADVGRAVHGHVPLERQPVVHQAKYTLLVLTSVPRAEDHGDLLLNVERDGDLAVQPVLLPVVVHLRARVDDRKVGLEPNELLARLRSNEHGHKVLLPRSSWTKRTFF